MEQGGKEKKQPQCKRSCRFVKKLEDEMEKGTNHVAENLGVAFCALMEAIPPPKENELGFQLKFNQTSFRKYLDRVLEITQFEETGFCGWGGGNPWAWIFHHTRKGIKRSITDVEIEFLMRHCKTLASSGLEFFSLKEIFILSSLLDYLNTHSIDPCNLFVAQYPSEIIRKFKYKHQQKGQRGQEGGPNSLPPSVPPTSPLTRRKSDEEKSAISDDSSLPFSSSSESQEPRSFSPSNHRPTSPSIPNSFLSIPSSKFLSKDPLSSSFPLPFQLINYTNPQNDNFDGLQSLVSRWNNIRKCPNFVEIEINILSKVLEMSLPHLPGDLVAVEIAEIPEPQRSMFTNEKWEQFTLWDSVFCRIKRWLPSSNEVEVWINPEEDIFIVVPDFAIISFDWEKIREMEILPQQDKGDCLSCIGDPLFVLQTQLHTSIEEQAKKTLIDNNIFLRKQEVDITDFSSLWENHIKFGNFVAKRRAFLGEEERGEGELKTYKDMEKVIDQWMDALPPFIPRYYYCQKQLIQKIKDMTSSLDYFFESTIQREYEASSGIIEAFRTKFETIADGRRKDAVCGWWLNVITEKSAEYLNSQKGFVKDSLPPDYTDTPPSDIQAVLSNLDIIQKLLVSKELKGFIKRLLKTIYTVLDKFLEELDFFLDPQTCLEPFVNDEEMQSLFEPDAVKAVQKDYEYLQKMKEMDMEILLKEENQGEGGEEEERKGLEMTDVVPVGGLIMARFHMQEVEHSTAVDMWGHHLLKGPIKRSTTTRNPSLLNSLKIANQIQEYSNLPKAIPDEMLGSVTNEDYHYTEGVRVISSDPPYPFYPSFPPPSETPSSPSFKEKRRKMVLESLEKGAMGLFDVLETEEPEMGKTHEMRSLTPSPSLPSHTLSSSSIDEKRELLLQSLENGEMGLFELLETKELDQLQHTPISPRSRAPSKSKFKKKRETSQTFLQFLGAEASSPSSSLSPKKSKNSFSLPISNLLPPRRQPSGSSPPPSSTPAPLSPSSPSKPRTHLLSHARPSVPHLSSQNSQSASPQIGLGAVSPSSPQNTLRSSSSSSPPPSSSSSSSSFLRNDANKRSSPSLSALSPRTPSNFEPIQQTIWKAAPPKDKLGNSITTTRRSTRDFSKKSPQEN